MILRGVTITECNVSKAEKKPHVGSCKIRFELTYEIAETMGWDCLLDGEKKPTNGWDILPLKGEIALVSARFKLNGKKSPSAEIEAQSIGSFAAHRLKAKGEEGTQFYLSAIIRTADEEFEQRMGPYWRGAADSASQLTLKEAQVSIFDGEPADEAEGN